MTRAQEQDRSVLPTRSLPRPHSFGHRGYKPACWEPVDLRDWGSALTASWTCRGRHVVAIACRRIKIRTVGLGRAPRDRRGLCGSVQTVYHVQGSCDTCRERLAVSK
ncbi:hypothetical protein K466DRAFT_389226 [Polyporus arcularius HHB13444]|uniref:Uncharacterized protein n=1 Tax=Polyporus arcularius HHB13444 TaxID=1314778 RepID=A0A5C3NTZ5_9APHY|nr:hypothetical protein K466DRAFT_389226 [Polyporus arcularius HHB13444]